MSTISPDQIKAIHAMLPGELKLDKEAKEEFVYSFTKDSAKLSTKDLTFHQANEMIIALGGRPHRYDHWAVFDRENTQHRNILSLLIQLGWSHYEANLGRHVADMVRFSEWLKSKRSPVSKKLKDMSVAEVSKIISALESMINKEYSK